MDAKETYAKLRKTLTDSGRIAIAFSGGTDSSLLAAAALETLGAGNTLLIHARSPMTPPAESAFAKAFAERRGLRILNIGCDPLSIESIKANDKFRCYHCKRMIMEGALKLAANEGFASLADGANLDDLKDWRPGMKASDELGVKHPFIEAGIGKRLIRLFARRLGLENWRSPAAACMASRIPTGTPLDAASMRMAAEAEAILSSMGFSGARARCLQGSHVKLEFNPLHLRRAFMMRETIVSKLKGFGFKSASLDLEGYRQGSMN